MRTGGPPHIVRNRLAVGCLLRRPTGVVEVMDGLLVFEK